VGAEIDASQLLATVHRMLGNREEGLHAAGLVILAVEQQTIHDGNPSWAGFRTLPKSPHQLLWETGTLIQSLALNGPGNVFEVKGDSVTTGTNVAYAAAQNYGYAPHDLPARPFMFIDDARQEQANKAYVNALLKGITR
jgi:phage gpG-like protein